jgi:hypothetical protein
MGELFRTLAPFQPPPPDGAGNPVDWGREEYARALLGDDFDLRFVHADDPLETDSAEDEWQLTVTSFGPIKMLNDSLDEGRGDELHRVYVERLEQYATNGHISAPREYLLILGRRR